MNASSARRVSVGVPFYNAEAFLAETLEALLAQSHGDLEILLSDNASTDGSPEIARAFAARDERVRYHRNPRNLGLASNYNLVFRRASAPYFKWATADDVCRPDFVARCLEALEGDEAAVLAYPRTLFIDGAGAPLDLEDRGFDLRGDDPAERLAYVIQAEGWVNAILGVIRTGALRATRLLPDYPGGDYALLGELCLQGRFLEVPEPLLLRRIHPEASSQVARDAQKIVKLITGHSGRISLPTWSRYGDHLRSIVGSRLPLRARLSLLRLALRRMRWRRDRLRRELALATRLALGRGAQGAREW